MAGCNARIADVYLEGRSSPQVSRFPPTKFAGFRRVLCHGLSLFALGVAALLAFANRSFAQTPVDTSGSEIITGKITTDSGVPIVFAQIVATRAPDRLSLAAQTDSAGRYRIVFSHGTGDYLLHVAMIGYGAVRLRARRTEGDSLIVVDATLSSTSEAQQLSAVTVVATRPRIERNPAPERPIGSADHDVPGLNGAIPPLQQGNLTALAAATPGIVPLTTGGFSALGLTSADNNFSLNGASFQGASVPRDARTTTRISTSVFDPAKGWFTGADVDVTLASGGPFSFRHSHITVDARPLQSRVDPTANGGRSASTQISFGGEGAITNTDRYVYSYGVQGARRFDPLLSISNTPTEIAQLMGVSPGVAARLVEALVGKGIPIGPPGSGSFRSSTDASFVARIDNAPYDWKTFTPKKSTWGVLTYGAAGRTDPTGIDRSTTGAFGGSSDRRTGLVQANYSSYDSIGDLTSLRSGLTYSRNSSSPYFQLPEGIVVLAPTDSSQGSGTAVFRFGTDPLIGAATTQWLWESLGERQFFGDHLAHHLLKVAADVRFDSWRQVITNERTGMFTYQSLADLEADSPSSFERSFGRPAESGSILNAFLSAGDYWKVNERLKLLYGIRVEGNRFLSPLSNNINVEQSFGIPTNASPGEVAVLPRLGFTWVRSAAGSGLRLTPLGGFNLGPTSYLRGGIGEFRNLVAPAVVGPSSIAASPPAALRRIMCVGAAVPSSNWAQFVRDPSSIPESCASAGSQGLASDAEDLAFLDPSYKASRAWRANLSYTADLYAFTYTVGGLYSINFRRPGFIDVNFLNSPQFTLANEGNRPVYVPSGAIAVSSGIPSFSGSRTVATFGQVMDQVSDLQSRTRQLSLTLSPQYSTLGNWFWSVNYTLAGSRQLVRGFDGTTFESPVDRDWARADLVPEHQFLLQGGVGSRDVSVTIFGHVRSGFQFTPMVSGDINGDGLANDRAFIFDPRVASDSLGAALKEFLASGPTRARSCLSRQLGQAAARNSCSGPWASTINAQLNLSGESLHLGKRATVALSLNNPMGGLDVLLHGSQRTHGWGEQPRTDPVFLTVRGFDPVTQTYRYTLNSRFGRAPLAGPTLRNPFRLTIDVALNLGPSIPEQQLAKSLSPGRRGRPGPRFTSSEIKARYARNVPDPYAQLLSESDSLLLSPVQIDSIVAADSAYKTRVDTIWTELADYLASLGDDYNAREAVRRANAATDEAWELSRTDIHNTLPRILSPIQLRLMPIAGLYDSRGPILGRTYRY